MSGKDDTEMPQNDTETDIADDEVSRESTIPSIPDPEILAAVKVPDWCDVRHIVVAWALSEGFSKAKAAKAAGVGRGAVYGWLRHRQRGPSFTALIERLTPLTGLAQSSARVGLAKELLQKLTERDVGYSLSKSDALGVMRFIREEVGARGIGAGHPAGIVVQQYFKGPTTINMGEGEEAEVIEGGGWEEQPKSDAGNPESEAVQLARNMLSQTEALQSEAEEPQP